MAFGTVFHRNPLFDMIEKSNNFPPDLNKCLHALATKLFKADFQSVLRTLESFFFLGLNFVSCKTSQNVNISLTKS